MRVVVNFKGLKVSKISCTQLIHGDPRLENFLFCDRGNPFCIIDFDTFMAGSIFTDLGDLLRSASIGGGETNLNFSLDTIKKIMKGYNSIANFDKYYFSQNSLNAFKQMTLELCARFLIDILEDKYFLWDKEKYKSRKDHNMARALCQWDLYEKISLLTHLELL